MIVISQCTWPISMGETWCPQGPWQVLALMLIVAGTAFLLLNAVQLSRPKKVIEFLPLKRVKGSSASTVIDPNFHQK
jgi:hypothetical protein